MGGVVSYVSQDGFRGHLGYVDAFIAMASIGENRDVFDCVDFLRDGILEGRWGRAHLTLVTRWPISPPLRTAHSLIQRDFLADEVQPDDRGALVLLEMAAHRVSHLGVKACEIVGLREDRSTRARAVYPPSGASSTIKMSSFMGVSFLPAEFSIP